MKRDNNKGKGNEIKEKTTSSTKKTKILKKKNNENLKSENAKKDNSVDGKSDSDVFIFAGSLIRANAEIAIDKIRKKENKSSKLLLVVSTLGGDPDQAYRLARIIKRHYKELRVFVPNMCKSAGTLVCLAANELIMTEFGELGPLDVQVKKENEFAGLSSGLDHSAAFEELAKTTMDAFRQFFLELSSGAELSTKLSAEIAAKLVSEPMGRLYSQIDPIRIGEISRLLEIARKYGRRLQSKNVKIFTVDKLIISYPSHSFVIDIEEAKELFHTVLEPKDGLSKFEYEKCEKIISSKMKYNRKIICYVNQLDALDAS